VGHGLLIIEASRSHSVTPHLTGLLWTSDHPDAGTSTRQHTTITTDRYPCPRRGFTRNTKSERPQTHALDRSPTGIDTEMVYSSENRCSIRKILGFMTINSYIRSGRSLNTKPEKEMFF